MIGQVADITGLLGAIAKGQSGPGDLFGVVYQELHGIARNHRRRWHGDNTMNTTALIHEAYLKLASQTNPIWRNRGHFFATAATAMRHILVNYAQRRHTAKRGGGAEQVAFDEELAVDAVTALELLVVDRALRKLETESVRACRVFECRVFAGLSQEETAEALEISRSTVKRDWLFASAVIHREVGQDLAVGA